MLLDKLLSNLSVHVKPFAICTVSDGWRVRLPGPPGLLFHFVLKGNGMLYGPRSDAHRIHPMHLAIVPQGAKHALETDGEIRDELRIDAPPPGDIVCQIAAGPADDPSLVVGCGIVQVRYGPSLDLFDHLKDVLSVDLSSVPEANTAFQGIMTEQANAIAGSDALTAALMTQCLVYLFRRLPSQDEAALPWLTALHDERLGRVVNMILENPGGEYSVEFMADTVAMSRSAFAEQFGKSFGRSPMNFINHVRMQRAAEYLSANHMSVDAIARAVGYSSRSHFSRAFRDHAGLSPQQFRVEHHA